MSPSVAGMSDGTVHHLHVHAHQQKSLCFFGTTSKPSSCIYTYFLAASPKSFEAGSKVSFGSKSSFTHWQNRVTVKFGYPSHWLCLDCNLWLSSLHVVPHSSTRHLSLIMYFPYLLSRISPCSLHEMSSLITHCPV